MVASTHPWQTLHVTVNISEVYHKHEWLLWIDCTRFVWWSKDPWVDGSIVEGLPTMCQNSCSCRSWVGQWSTCTGIDGTPLPLHEGSQRVNLVITLSWTVDWNTQPMAACFSASSALPGVPSLVSLESLVQCNSVWIPAVAKAFFFLLYKFFASSATQSASCFWKPLFVACCSDSNLEGGPDGFHTRQCRSSVANGTVSIQQGRLEWHRHVPWEPCVWMWEIML